MPRFKNILLVYPKIPGNTYWSFKHALKFIAKKSSMPPLGLPTIAAYFPDTYNLRLVDMNIQELNDETLLWADAVFISAMIIQKESMAAVAQRSKKLNKPVIVGGPYPTGSWHEITFADHFVLGEAEEIVSEFLKDFENGTARKVYHADKYPNISQLPVPRFDLLNIKAYGSMAVQYSRGCPYTCEFCDIWKNYGNKPRLKHHDVLIDELETLYQLGWRGAVFIVDDNFIGNKHRVKKHLLPALEVWQKDHDYAFRFFTEASINLSEDDNLLQGMKNAGFNEVFIGIETPDEKALLETGKKQNLKTDMSKAVRKIQSFGIEVMAGFIVGFDSDTADTFQNQISFINKTAIPKAMVGLLTALPGTNLYLRLKRDNRLLDVSNGNNTHSMKTNFETKMDSIKLKEGYVKILSSLYGSKLKNYFSRCSNLFDNLGNNEYFQRKIGCREMIMLLKSIVRQPFTSYGFQYLKFLSRSVVKHPDLFGEAVKCGIIGHHFHIITGQLLRSYKLETLLDTRYNYFKEQLKICSSNVTGNPSKTLKKVSLLREKCEAFLKQIQKKINSTHSDFREELNCKFLDISERLKDQFEHYGYLSKSTQA